jgi:hypothetical protein
MKRALFAIGAVVAAAIALPLRAQTMTPELRPFVGAYVPTGAMRDIMKSSALFGVEGAFEVNPNLHLIGTFSWSPAHNKFTGYDENLSLYSFDVGAELGLVRPLPLGWEFKPFFGLGGGARKYDYKDTQFPSRSWGAGYVSLGTEFQLSAVALRIEARENFFGYKSPFPGATSGTRNDATVLFGFAYHFR